MPQTAHAGVKCGLPLVINLLSTVPQTQWHAPANMEHMAENKSVCVWRRPVHEAAVIGTSCALSLWVSDRGRTRPCFIFLEILAPLLQKHLRGEMVFMFCFAETTCKDKHDISEDEKPNISIASAVVVNSSVGGEVNSSHQTALFFSATVQELSGSTSFLFFFVILATWNGSNWSSGGEDEKVTKSKGRAKEGLQSSLSHQRPEQLSELLHAPFH